MSSEEEEVELDDDGSLTEGEEEATVSSDEESDSDVEVASDSDSDGEGDFQRRKAKTQLELMKSFSDELKQALIPWRTRVSPIVVGVLRDWFLAIPRLDDDFSKLDQDEVEDHFTPRAGWYSGKTMFYFLDANRDGFVTEEEFVIGLLRVFRMKLASGYITGASVKEFILRFQRSRKQGVRDRLRREKRQQRNAQQNTKTN